MPAKIITVSTAAQLQSALAKATGGETILLAAGNYGQLQLTNGKTKFDVTHSAEAPVTIRSADASKPAVFTTLDLRDTSGFTFENIKFDYTYNASNAISSKPFNLLSCDNMTFRGCTFDGSVAVGRNATDNGFGFGIGFSAGGGKNLVFENNTLFNFHRGATFGGETNAIIRGNDIHSMRSDGMNFTAMKGVLIENNHLHDFKRSLSSTDHADMIQFWTDGTKTPSTDIVIRGNLFDIGKGSGTQTILMGNEEVQQGKAGPEMFYRNVLIEGNTIYNDHMHGITVGASAGLIIRNNAVLQANGASEGVTGSVSVPKINVAPASTGVTIVDNLAGGISGSARWTVSNNLIVQNTDQSAPNHYTDLFVSASLPRTSGGHDFLALPGGLIESMDIGPGTIRIDGAPAKIVPLFHVSTLPTNDSVFVFDAASYTNGPLGAITPELGTFLWNFGDGNSGTGGVVAHRYLVPGNYTVTVSVVQPDGKIVSTSGITTASTVDLLRLDTKKGNIGVATDTGEILAPIAKTALVGKAGAWALDLGKTGVTASVSNTRIEELFGADNFALDLRLKADTGMLSHGEVFRVHGSFIATVNSAGQFVFQIWGAEGQRATLTSTGPNLLDGKSHNVSIRFDADLGFLKLTVDGKSTVSVPFTADLPDMGSSGFVFGNPWGRKNFDGQLQAFDLNVGRSDYPVYDGSETPAESHPTVLGVKAAALAPTALMPDALVPAMHLVDADAPDVRSLNDHVLDGAAMAALRASALRGDTHLVVQDGRTMLAFDGKGDQAVMGRLNDFANSDQLAISVEFQRDAADGSSGRLISNPGQVTLSVHGDSFRVHVATADAGMKLFNLGSLGLNDTDWHKAMVLLDTEADRLQVFVDNHLVLDDQSHDFVMVNPGGVGRGWVAGTGFDGRISEIRIDDDIAPLALKHPVSDELTAFL